MKDAEREVGNDMFTQKFMQEIERSFEAQLNRLGERRTEVEAALVKCSNDEAEALKCLYASMPVSDAADYEAELFLSYAKHGVFLFSDKRITVRLRFALHKFFAGRECNQQAKSHE